VNLLKSPLRRTTAVLAGAFIGLAGAVALAAPANAHNADLNGTPSCVTEGGWKIDWSLLGKNAPGAGTILEGYSYGETSGGSALTKLVPGGSVPTGQTITETQTFPVTVKQVELHFKIEWTDNAGNDRSKRGGKDGHYTYDVAKTVVQPEGCKPPATKPPVTTPPPAPGEPTPTLDEDCTSITIGLDNPKDGKEITLKFKTSKGEERTTVIKPGEKKSEKFSATPGFTVTVSAEGLDGGTETIPYEQPEGCDNNGGGGGLPVTGAAAGGIAGGAGLLLAAGAGLVLMARRRKLKFTA
jgi:hypothetical protein